MNSLHLAIKEAFASSGSLKEANKVYLEFIKANFIIPVEQDNNEEEPRVLFLNDSNGLFLPVFTERDYLDAWASEISQDINVLKLSGVDLLKGVGDDVTVCLDLGSASYKEFNPAEIARMRSMVLKLFNNEVGNRPTK